MDGINKPEVLITLTVLSAISLILVDVFIVLALGGVVPFNNTLEAVSVQYETDITPAGYTDIIWNVIFFMQSVWVIYALIALCRKNAHGPVYLHPVTLPVWFQVQWIISCAFYIGWLFAWNRAELWVSFSMALAVTVAGFNALAFQTVAIAKHEEKMLREARVDLILVYVFVQNGLGLFYAWTTVETLLEFAVALTYDSVVSEQNACLISLIILLVLVILWSGLENTLLFKYFKYLYTWHATMIWAATGILVKNSDYSNRSSSLTITILVVAIVCLLIKIVVFVLKRSKNPSPMPENEALIPGN